MLQYYFTGFSCRTILLLLSSLSLIIIASLSNSLLGCVVLSSSELNRNRVRQVEGLTFQGLASLEVLKLQRNNISKLTDGAFWGLAKMKVL